MPTSQSANVSILADYLQLPQITLAPLRSPLRTPHHPDPITSKMEEKLKADQINNPPSPGSRPSLKPIWKGLIQDRVEMFFASTLDCANQRSEATAVLVMNTS